MPEVTETVDVDAPPGRTWAALTDWIRSGEWMLATDVRTVGGPAQGIGGRLAARTGVPVPGGWHLGVLDTMEITGWDPPRRVEVRHTGRVVRGGGVFEVRPHGAGSTLVWTEDLDLPLGALGRLGWPLVSPAVRAGLRFSLRRFAGFAREHAG
jgi:Polyketide cyclase / dehydrase and lipid transport